MNKDTKNRVNKAIYRLSSQWRDSIFTFIGEYDSVDGNFHIVEIRQSYEISEYVHTHLILFDNNDDIMIEDTIHKKDNKIIILNEYIPVDETMMNLYALIVFDDKHEHFHFDGKLHNRIEYLKDKDSDESHKEYIYISDEYIYGKLTKLYDVKEDKYIFEDKNYTYIDIRGRFITCMEGTGNRIGPVTLYDISGDEPMFVMNNLYSNTTFENILIGSWTSKRKNRYDIVYILKTQEYDEDQNHKELEMYVYFPTSNVPAMAHKIYKCTVPLYGEYITGRCSIPTICNKNNRLIVGGDFVLSGDYIRELNGGTKTFKKYFDEYKY